MAAMSDLNRRGGHDTKSPRRVLLLTNSEYGQANVFLATSQALLDLGEDVEVHLASFLPLEKVVSKIESPRLFFHEIMGTTMQTAWSRPEVAAGAPEVQTFRNAPRMTTFLLKIIFPWTPPEFVEILENTKEIIQRVGADVVAVDPGFAPGLTACDHLGVKWVVLSPNSIKDFAMAAQPRLAPLWKYPFVGSALSFPLPWHLIPLNIYFCLVAGVASHRDKRRQALDRYVQSRAAAKRIISLHELSMHVKVKVLVANLPELEYPLQVIPDHIIPCGPMIRQPKPISDLDEELGDWMGRGPTIYINLGTHLKMPEEDALEMATALRSVLDLARSAPEPESKLQGLQVLWKLFRDTDKKGDYAVHDPGSRVHQVLGKYLDADIVRVVEWIKPDPNAVLQKAVLAVHHGGANSFLEAASMGIPQVVLPAWLDTFDYANRAEIAGIGLWGSRTARPWFKADELGLVLARALFGSEAASMNARAKKIARLCNANGGGAVVAARVLLDETRGEGVQ